MKRKYLTQLLTILLIMQLVVVGRVAGADRVHDIAVQAYIYAYPMIMMEVTRQVSINVPAPRGAPMNQFAHMREFPDHTFREVVRPNADTLYSILWFDVSQEPQVISIPDTGGRYYLLPMMDMWTDIFASPGSRTSGTKAANFAIVGPDWKGTLPNGIEKIRSPTNIGWVIGRTQTNGAADYKNVHQIQNKMKVTPLSHWGTSYTPPAKLEVDSRVDIKTPPPIQVARMEARTYFELFAKLMKNNPPHELDWSMVAQLKQIGIFPGKDLDFDELDAQTQKAMKDAVGEAQKMIVDKAKRSGESVNGWMVARDGIGTYGTSYLQRANIARVGLGANVPEDAIYPMSIADWESGGLPYNGSYEYILHFDKNEIPPVNAFWSLAMYDENMYFAANPIRRYSIGDRDQLQFNKDGSLDIYIQHASPGKDKESNWLPAPDGNFDLVLRLYWPKTEVLTGAWEPPPVKKK